MTILIALWALFQATPAAASTSLYLEPMVFTGAGMSDFNAVFAQTSGNVRVDRSSGLTIDYGGTIRFGASNEDLFSALEVSYGMGPIGGATGQMITFGFTVGATLKYTPIRLVFGYDFSDGYSDSSVALGGSTFRAGIGYYLSESLLLNLDISRHIYTGVENRSGVGASLPNSVSFNAATLSVSLPMTLTGSDTPWRTRYRAKAFDSTQTSAETPTPPPAEEAPAPPASDAPSGDLPPALPADGGLGDAPPPPSEQMPPNPQ